MAGTSARDERPLDDAAAEPAALRRVATLIAREASQAEVFTAIAEEIGRLLGAEGIRMLRYEGGTSAVIVGAWGEHAAGFPVGTRHPLGGNNAASHVFLTGQPARIEDTSAASGSIGESARAGGLRCVVATPITVNDQLWGAVVTGTTRDVALRADTESRLAHFTELLAIAIAGTESRARADRLTDEQAALRRVATLVAEGLPPADLFTAVSQEVSRLFGCDFVAVGRFEHSGPGYTLLGLAKPVDGLAIGSRWGLDDTRAAARVYRSGRPARVELDAGAAGGGPLREFGRRMGVGSVVASPIVVERRLWGAITVFASESLPDGTEERLAEFTRLVATAIANAESQQAVRRLAEEQAALRRVATLVAQGRSTGAVFDAVAAEMERLTHSDGVTLSRYEPGDELTLVAHSGAYAWRMPPGTRLRPEPATVAAVVRRTERPARVERHPDSGDGLREIERHLGVYTAVGAPIVLDRQLWGVIVANWRTEGSPPGDTEQRMAQFGELLDTAIANADSRDQLMASRARLLTTADDARRRVARDLHDGAQQRLVHSIITLKLAQQALRSGSGAAEALVTEALEHAEQGNAELRELAHGILPANLANGGLRAAIDTLVARLALPVAVDVGDERFPPAVEASAYFIVAEALTNLVKHARATRAEVKAAERDGVLHIDVRDDGRGGADPDGRGLVGLADRATALGGRLTIDSPPGRGTHLAATLPLPSR